jgi:hypothetical protein
MMMKPTFSARKAISESSAAVPTAHRMPRPSAGKNAVR